MQACGVMTARPRPPRVEFHNQSTIQQSLRDRVALFVVHHEEVAQWMVIQVEPRVGRELLGRAVVLQKQTP